MVTVIPGSLLRPLLPLAHIFQAPCPEAEALGEGWQDAEEVTTVS